MSAVRQVSPPILSRVDDAAIAILTLDCHPNRNALSEAMLAALTAEFAAITDDASVRAVVIAAKGPLFCPGHDLKEMTAHRSDADRGREYFEDIFGRCSAMMQMMARLPQPVIAAIEGIATAAGCQLVATCDLAIAGSEARFGASGVNYGLFCSTPMVALSRNIARKHSLEMLMTGELIDATEAQRIGLVNRVAPAGKALDAALDLARVIAAKPPAAIKAGKQAFYQQIEMPLAEAYAHTSRVIVENMLAGEAEEGISAFIEKRAPRWPNE
ncbi:MAG: enoyl-CoA hydratase [Beijerinckiaceae bacterium]